MKADDIRALAAAGLIDGAALKRRAAAALPDYVGNLERVHNWRDVDLSIDPPPDLALEVDVTRSCLNRLEIYAALGVAEVWRFDGEQWQVELPDCCVVCGEPADRDKLSIGFGGTWAAREGLPLADYDEAPVAAHLKGQDISGLAAPQRTLRGMGRAFQLTNLFPNLTVLENVRLAVQARAGMGLNLWSMWSRHGELTEKAEHFLARVALRSARPRDLAALRDGLTLLPVLYRRGGFDGSALSRDWRSRSSSSATATRAWSSTSS